MHGAYLFYNMNTVTPVLSMIFTKCLSWLYAYDFPWIKGLDPQGNPNTPCVLKQWNPIPLVLLWRIWNPQGNPNTPRVLKQWNPILLVVLREMEPIQRQSSYEAQASLCGEVVPSLCH